MHAFNILLLLLIFCYNTYATKYHSSFSEACYFSKNSNYVLVTELNFIHLDTSKNEIPVYGLYRLGYNEKLVNIAIDKDSIYYFTYEYLLLRIDSTFKKQLFLKDYYAPFQSKNINKWMQFEVITNKLYEVNTLAYLHLDTLIKKPLGIKNTSFYNHIINFKFGNKLIYIDTLLNSYADRQFIINGLNEFDKKIIYDGSNYKIGTLGYGTRIFYCKKNKQLFIRAKIDLSSHVAIQSEDEIELIDPISLETKKTVVRSSSEKQDYPKELRILINLK